MRPGKVGGDAPAVGVFVQITDEEGRLVPVDRPFGGNSAGIVVGVALLLLAVAVAATFIPAWRAARTQPVRVLREE